MPDAKRNNGKAIMLLVEGKPVKDRHWRKGSGFFNVSNELLLERVCDPSVTGILTAAFNPNSYAHC